MLVKFGEKGQQVSEYFLEDGSTMEDLLSMLNIDLDTDDIIHDSYSPTDPIDENYIDHELEEGAVYVLETVQLTQQEEDIIAIVNNADCVDDLSVSGQKDLVKRLVNRVQEGSWDK